MSGRDESVNSLNRAMYLEALQFLRDHNEEIRAVILENALNNCILTSSMIQNWVFCERKVNCICLEIGNDVFSLLVDKSSDVVKKEQMAVVLSYEDKVTTEQAICVVLKVLHYVEEEGDTISNRGTTYGLIKATGFASLMKNGTSFCGKHDIEMVNMGDLHSSGRMDRITNRHHLEV
ncbi:zinc finger MYM-type protein 1-like protein, partial [Tanacetum coccineum]